MSGRPSPGTDVRRILVVDDSDSVRSVVRQQLEAAGYVVVEADSVDAALILVREAPPNLVVTDIQMPGRSGIELIHEVRREFPNVLILAMSGAAALDQALWAGA